MSRGYYKTCGRKVAPPPPSQSIQFNKIFCENSNKPSAAKSTGTLGKWGITSFTSIRSSSFTVGRKGDSVGYKRSRYETSKSNDNFDFSSAPTPGLSPAEPKPKKFFKSRNTDDKDKSLSSATTTSASKKANSKRNTYKRALSEQLQVKDEIEDYGNDVISDRSSPETVEDTSNNSHNPPIVLRIFKGTAQLLTEDSYTPPKKEKDRESRRRAHSTDSYEYTAPKKHRHRLRDIESLRNDLEGEEELAEEEDKFVPSEEPVKEEIDEGEEEVLIKDEEIKEEDQEIKEEQEFTEGQEELKVEEPEDTSRIVDGQEYLNMEMPLKIDDEIKIDEVDLSHRVLKENQQVLSSMEYNDIDVKVDEILDLSSTVKEVEEPPYNEDEEDEPSDLPLDLHVPAPQYELVKPAPIIMDCTEGRFKNDKSIDESNSDSDYSETLERPSVVQMARNEPARNEPKPNLRAKSIFKSRGEKRNAHYIHKWCDKDEGNKQTPGVVPPLKIVEGEFSDSLTRVTNYAKPDEFSEESEMFTSVTCSKTSKEFYTVVRNVKKAHQIQESGEFQEFNDDVEYILDALQDNNPIGTRCLSAITLASKCMVPAFRMHVRAHGTVAKFFKALHDASKDQSLGMCTATVMFVLSQDRLNMDLDRESLELMLSLLESDASSQALDECGFTDAQLTKTKDRVKSLCQEIKEQGHANHLNLDNITVGQLAMETLLSLTSKRAGEWFKEELRDLGGLEHIVRTIVETASCVHPGIPCWSPVLLDRMRKLDRCLRVLENVTLNNEDNSNYLLTYGDGQLVDTVLRVFMTCGSQLLLYPVTSAKDKVSVGAVLKDCLVSTLKILINITHDFNNKSCGSALAGTKPGLIDSSLHVLFIVPDYVPEDQKFDLIFMSLMLLINLVEHCEANRKLLMQAQAPPVPDVLIEGNHIAIASLVTLFIQQEELARNVERKTDAILDGENKPPEMSKSHEEYIEETVALLIQKAGKHMEYTLVAAYIATLLGYLTINNEEYEYIIRCYLPNQNFALMLSVLKKFYDFMTLTATSGSASTRGIKATEMLIKHLTEVNQKIKEETE